MNDLYLDLLKKTLTDYNRVDEVEYVDDFKYSKRVVDKLLSSLNSIIARKNIAIMRRKSYKKEDREIGKDWPTKAETMIGLKRLDNIEFCIEQILKNDIPGDLIETGVWRGGATIFMKAALTVKNDRNRVVWVADSFMGLPKPNDDLYVADKGDTHHEFQQLKINLEIVKGNFRKYGLLDDRVKFLEGWFKDTLPVAPIESLSLLRLDGDMYESTMDAITNLYPKLSVGGYIIVDDYGAVEGCKQAIEDYRTKFGISESMIPIDWTGVYWQKKIQ